jgi:adenosine deaminase
VHTGAVRSVADHPFGILYQNKFRVTLNTDNRLMSGISLTDEYHSAVQAFGLTVEDLEKITLNAMKSAFASYKQRIGLIFDVIKPGFAKAGAD